MTSGVYFIRNCVNGKVYIGSSVAMRSRLNKHLSDLKRGMHPNEFLQRSYLHHGADAFEFGVLEKCEKDVRLVREQWWMDHFSSNDETKGYNLIPTREAQLYGQALSVHQRRGWAALSKEERQAIAKHLTDPEMKKKAQALANIARATPEHRVMRQEIAARTVATEATRKKNSERLKALWQDPEFRAKRLAGLAVGREKTNARFETDPEYRARKMAIFADGRRKAKENADRRKQVMR